MGHIDTSLASVSESGTLLTGDSTSAFDPDALSGDDVLLEGALPLGDSDDEMLD